MNELILSLNGTEIKCKIGFGATLAATDYLREQRKNDYRSQRDMFAELGDSVETKAMLTGLLESYLQNQIPTEGEVKGWLQSMEGIKFALKHGTQRYPIKLTDETVELVMDDLSQEKFREITQTIAEICHGEIAAKIQRGSAEQMIEIAKLELEGLVKQKEEFAKKIRGMDSEAEAPGVSADADQQP